ncbi:MAG: hypothetical protein AAGJ35_16090, partial [Myxococcota bacterium]
MCIQPRVHNTGYEVYTHRKTQRGSNMAPPKSFLSSAVFHGSLVILTLFLFNLPACGPSTEQEPGRESTVWTADGSVQTESTDTDGIANVTTYTFVQAPIQSNAPFFDVWVGRDYQVVGGNAFYRSENATRWFRLPVIAQVGQIQRIHERNGVLLAVEGSTQEPYIGQILRSTDKAKSWDSVLLVREPKEEDHRLFDVAWSTDTIALAMGKKAKLFRTETRGLQWKSLPVSNNLRTIDVVRLQYAFLRYFAFGSDSSILQSLDNGVKWTKI